MRHGHGLRKLNRTTSHRLAMFRNMANSLLTHEQITTTLPKAKELRRGGEPMITLGKSASLANRRLAYNPPRDHHNLAQPFAQFGPRHPQRNGGYPRLPQKRFPQGGKPAAGAVGPP